MKIQISTRFDITATGTRGNFNANRLPFRDRSGQHIATEGAWHRSRNQQRNWETMNQLISLRTLPQDIQDPVQNEDDQGRIWSFDFDLENTGALEQEGDPVGALKADSTDVPMIVGLGEDAGTHTHLMVGTNVWFQAMHDK